MITVPLSSANKSLLCETQKGDKKKPTNNEHQGYTDISGHH